MKKQPLALFGPLLAIAATGCGQHEQPGNGTVHAQSAAPPLAVQTVRPETRDVARVIRLPGDVIAFEEATLYAKVAGYLDRISVDKGDRVRAGQVLAVIRAPELEADRAQARESYLAALESAK